MGIATLIASAAALQSHAIPPNIANITFLTDAAANLGAVCLDGSPAAFYLRVEPGGEPNKFYIHQQGGGWCESDDDCYGRSKTALGSSKGYASSMNLGGGYFSNDPAINPMMHNYSKIFLPYCDGGSQTGDLADPVSVSGTNIYYRGNRILKAMIPYLLKNTNLGSATDIIISGCSAGGLSTFLHADSWKDAAPSGSKVAALPDSGFFLDYSTTVPGRIPYSTSLRWVYTRMNGTFGVPQRCAAANPTDPARCIFAEHVSPTLETPFFPLQSVYDSWQEGNILDSNNATLLNEYGELLASRVQNNLLANPQNSVFLDSCNHHCGEWGNIVINGDNQATAMQKWYNALGSGGSQVIWNQNKPYPCTACCSP